MLGWKRRVDPGRVISAAGGSALAELLVVVLVSLTGNRLLTGKSRGTRRRQEWLVSALVRYGRPLDPDGSIRRARDLAIAEEDRAHASAGKLLGSLPMLPGWVLPVAAVVMAGLEASFIATFFYDNVKQGVTWWSVEGAVSVLVAAIHPLLVTLMVFLAARLMTRGGRRWPAGFVLVVVLPLDVLAVWVLTTYIVGSALVEAAAAGLPVADFPAWVFALLFTLLPVVLVGAVIGSSDEEVAAVQAVRRQGRKAARRSAARQRLIWRLHRRVSRAWLVLFQHVVDSARALANIRSTGEYGIVETRAQGGTTNSPAPEQQPALGGLPEPQPVLGGLPEPQPAPGGVAGSVVDPVAGRLAVLAGDVLPHLQRARHLALSPGEQVLVDDLIHAAALLVNNPVPTPAQVQERITAELGGSAAVSDPGTWRPFQPDDVQVAAHDTSESGEFVPDDVQVVSGPGAGGSDGGPAPVKLPRPDARVDRQPPAPAASGNGGQP